MTHRAGPVLLGFQISPLYSLLALVPIAIGLRLVEVSSLWIFIASGLAIIPLASLMGQATESLAEELGAGVGGFLNATFGNAAELIIAVMALMKGPQLYPLVKASITGSIIGNILLVLGLSILVGGLRFPRQEFNRTAASMGTTLLALASIGLLVPTVCHTLDPSAAGQRTTEYLSIEIAGILAFVYLLSLVFSLRTHRHLFTGAPEELPQAPVTTSTAWGRTSAVLVLLGSTAAVAVLSEQLAGSVELAAEALGMNRVFIGVVVVAIIGNAAEHSTAVLMARKNKMDLAMHIAIGSSLQVALLVAPVLVFASMALYPSQSLDLHFTPLELVALVAAIGTVALVSHDGESHWMEGVMLLAVYVIFGLAFYHMPEEPGPHEQTHPPPASSSAQTPPSSI